MTSRYTQDEWLAIFNQAEKTLAQAPVKYKAPALGTKEFAKAIDHTLLKGLATKEQIGHLCEEARKHDFKVHRSALPSPSTQGQILNRVRVVSLRASGMG